MKATDAILRAEQLPPGAEAVLAWLEVSEIEHSLAQLTEPETVQGAVARRGAITAALSAEHWSEAQRLADHYLAQELPDWLEAEIRALRTQAERSEAFDELERATRLLGRGVELLGLGVVWPERCPAVAPEGYGFEVLATLKELGLDPYREEVRLSAIVAKAVDAAMADGAARKAAEAKLRAARVALMEIERIQKDGRAFERVRLLATRGLQDSSGAAQSPPDPEEV